MPKLSDIRASVIARLADITVANGYKTELSSANIFFGHSPEGNPQLGPTAYPRCTVFTIGSDYSSGPQRRLGVTTVFSIFFAFSRAYAALPGDPTLTEQIEAMYEDIERWADRNAQLGGADQLKLTAAADDLGVSVTEAVLVAQIEIDYRRNMALEP